MKPSRFMKKSALLCAFLLAALFYSFMPPPQNGPRVLVFSKTEGFRHTSIEPGKTAFKKMAEEKGFTVDLTEDAAQFTNANLKNYNAVIFLNTTGDVLNDAQQEAFERYIQAGGGYVGIHAATDCEYNWPWYGQLAGAYFLDHPMTPSNVQQGKFYVTDKSNFATQGMPDTFLRKDEFYSFKQISPAIKVVVKIDESSYQGGKNGADHPMSWYHEYDGGRAFYTAMGHTDESFAEPLFLAHVWAGLQYAMGGSAPVALDYSRAKPEENRFTKVVLQEKLNEPMELSVLNDGRVLFIERHGAVKLYNTKTKVLKTIATIPVSTKYKDKEGKESEAEDGLLGLSKDPAFATNHWIYLYYSDPNKSQNILTRYTLNGDVLDVKSKKVLLEVPTQREQCCHTGGSIDWDAAGNLYISTGDNTSPRATAYAPIDEREGRSPWDAQKSSANTNDLRGKIIRIKPQPNGKYVIPDGNLFAKNTALTRPEIYTMGHRNPFRISVDKHTGFVYWGDVGPDANNPDSAKGPAAQDEVGQAKKAGNFGWPHFVGDNKAYNHFDFATNQSRNWFDAQKPLNESPNNTGLKELPPAQKAFIWYPYGESKEFPLVGTGGRTAMAGPVFYSDDFKNASRSFPKYYNGKLFIYEWMRGWIMAVTLDKEGNYVSMERFMPSYKFSNPMDMEFADNGDLYMLEYGSGWFTANDDARLIRIEYNGGNRKPAIVLDAERMGGALPFAAKLSSKGTKDADGDTLQYAWKITSKNGYIKNIQGPDANVTFTKPGVYKATLTVKDGKGGVSTQSMELTAGNEPATIQFDMGKSNKSFYTPNKNYQYKVAVKDKEDGSLANGRIKPEQVVVNIDYLPEGHDKNEIAMGHRTAEAAVNVTKGNRLIQASDCRACHGDFKKSIGPTYKAVSLKYKPTNANIERLTKKIISGGKGVWGDVAMPAHPQLSAADASEMVKYILSLSQPKPKVQSLPTQGSYTTKPAANDKGEGVYIFRAAYRDRGANGLPSVLSEESFTLRNPQINPTQYDVFNDVNKMSFNGNSFVIPTKPGSYIGLKNIDLTGITAIEITAMAPKQQLNAAGGIVELRLDKPNGTRIGQTPFIDDKASGSVTAGFNAAPVALPVTPTEGFHDIYLVFQNPNAPAAQSLMIVLNTNFKTGDSSGAPATQSAATKADLNDYTGKYKMTGLPFEYVEMSVQDGKLLIKAGDQQGAVTPLNEADAFDAAGKATLYFIRDEKKKVNKLQLKASGFTFEGDKE